MQHATNNRRIRQLSALLLAVGAGFVLAKFTPPFMSRAEAQVSTGNPVITTPARISDLIMIALPGGQFDVMNSNRSEGETAIKQHLAQGYRVLGISNDRVYLLKP